MQLFLNEELEFENSITYEEFIAFLRGREEFAKLFEFLDRFHPNLRHHLRLLGRKWRDLIIVGTEDTIAQSMCGARLAVEKGPRSCIAIEQRIYLSKSAKQTSIFSLPNFRYSILQVTIPFIPLHNWEQWLAIGAKEPLPNVIIEDSDDQHTSPGTRVNRPAREDALTPIHRSTGGEFG